MTKAQLKNAQQVADLANLHPGTISYEVQSDRPVIKEFGVTWYPMLATDSANGSTWDYLLAKDFGDYRGAFPGAE